MEPYGDISQLQVLERGISAICLLGDSGSPPVLADVSAIWQGIQGGVVGQTIGKEANWAWLWDDKGNAFLHIGGLNSSVMSGITVSGAFTGPVWSTTSPANLIVFFKGLASSIYNAVGQIPAWQSRTHYLFGHSLGGVLVQAVRDWLKAGTPALDTRVYTYGSPKCYKAGTQGARSVVFTQIAVQSDPINRLPPNQFDCVEGAFLSPIIPSPQQTFRNSNEFAAVGRMVVIARPQEVLQVVATPLLTRNQLQDLVDFVKLGVAIGEPHRMQTYRDILRWALQEAELPPIRLNLTPADLAKLTVVPTPPTPPGPVSPVPNLPQGGPGNYVFRGTGRPIWSRTRPGTQPPDPGPINPMVGPPIKPRIISYSPASGPPAGNTTVTIRGTGLSSVTAVAFGPRLSLNVSHPQVAQLADTLLIATAPPNVDGQVRLGLVYPGGLVQGRASQVYEYAGA